MRVRKGYLYSFLSALVLIVFSTLLIPYAGSYHDGAPLGRSGGPSGGGRTCGDAGACHNTDVSHKEGLILTNIDTSGYMPDSTYTITARIDYEGRNTFGFQLSPQNHLAEYLGKLVSLDSETQTQANNHYITHTETGTSGSNGEKSWTFEWVAPEKGAGMLTFYAAFNAADGDGTESGDKIFFSMLDVYEHGTASTENSEANQFSITVYPNPVKDFMHIRLPAFSCEFVNIKLTNLSGQKIQAYKVKYSEFLSLRLEDKPAGGTYVLSLNACERHFRKIIFIQD
jgi:hypothetical protein